MEEIIVSDQTLRDGEQQVGVFFTLEEKLSTARELRALGVHHIAMMPAASQDDLPPFN